MHSALYLTLTNFIERRMQMQHIYQPVMIKTLLENDGHATVRQIAQEFLAKDQSQLEYYEVITKRMPGRVLSKHGIVEQQGDSFQLLGKTSELTQEEKRAIINLCERKLEQYVTRPGNDGFNHRGPRRVTSRGAYAIKYSSGQVSGANFAASPQARERLKSTTLFHAPSAARTTSRISRLFAMSAMQARATATIPTFGISTARTDFAPTAAPFAVTAQPAEQLPRTPLPSLSGMIMKPR